MRGRTVMGEPGSAVSVVSPIFLGRENRERSVWRCCSVERRRDEERLGIVLNGLLKGGTGEGKDGVSVTAGVSAAKSSTVLEGGPSLSKILNSLV
jgi:hypothetical protein